MNRKSFQMFRQGQVHASSYVDESDIPETRLQRGRKGKQVRTATESPLFVHPTGDDGNQTSVRSPTSHNHGFFDWARPNIAGSSNNGGGARQPVAAGAVSRLTAALPIEKPGTMKKLFGNIPRRNGTLKSNFGTLKSGNRSPTTGTELVNGVHMSIIEIGGLDRLRDLMYCFYADNNFEKLIIGEVDVEEKVDHVASLGLDYLNTKLDKKYGRTLADLNIPISLPTAQASAHSDSMARTEQLLSGIAGKVWSDGLRLELELFFLQHDPRVLREPQFNALLTYVELCGGKRLDMRLLKLYGKALNMGGQDGRPSLPPSFLSSAFRETYRKVLLHVLKEFYRELDNESIGNKDIELNYIADWILKNGLPKLNTRLMSKYGQDLVNFLMETPFWERKQLVQPTYLSHMSSKSSLFGPTSGRFRRNSHGSPSQVLTHSSAEMSIVETRHTRSRRNSEPQIFAGIPVGVPIVEEGNPKNPKGKKKKKKHKGRKKEKQRSKASSETRSPVLSSDYASFSVDEDIVDLKSDLALKQEVDLFLMRHDPMAILDGLDLYMYKYGQAYGRERLSEKLELRYGVGLPTIQDGGQGTKLLGAKLTMNKGSRKPSKLFAVRKENQKYAEMLGRSELTAAEVEFVKGWAELANNQEIGTELDLTEV